MNYIILEFNKSIYTIAKVPNEYNSKYKYFYKNNVLINEKNEIIELNMIKYLKVSLKAFIKPTEEDMKLFFSTVVFEGLTELDIYIPNEYKKYIHMFINNHKHIDTLYIGMASYIDMDLINIINEMNLSKLVFIKCVIHDVIYSLYKYIERIEFIKCNINIDIELYHYYQDSSFIIKSNLIRNYINEYAYVNNIFIL